MKPLPKRPLHGIYHILEGGHKVGWEEWKLFVDGDAIHFRSRIVRETPMKLQENLRLTLDLAWDYRSLVIILQGVDGTDRTYDGRVEGDRWIMKVTSTQGELLNWGFSWNRYRELDYRSPLFNAVTLHRLGLREGQEATIDTLFLEPERYLPREVKQRYTRQEDDHLHIAAGRFHALRYVYENLASGATGTLWTDLRGTVIRFSEWELMKYEEE